MMPVMIAPFDPTRLAPPAQKVLAAEAPLPLRTMAARGVLPGAKPADLVSVLAVFGSSEQTELAELARTTLGKVPTSVLHGALDAPLQSLVLDVLAARWGDDPEVVTRLLRQEDLAESTLGGLASRANERTGELIATNEERLLRHPIVIEKLYMNKRVRMSTADRLIDLAVRNGIELGLAAYKEAAQAIKNELIVETTEARTFDDQLFEEIDQVAQEVAAVAGDEDTHETDEEGEERLREKFIPLHLRIAQMTVSQKIRRAMLGTATERLLLVRDHNRLVSIAAAKSPQMKEPEAALISASRNVSDEVLRVLAMNREFTRSYRIKFNLITNPRTPFTFVSRLVPHLRDNDLRTLAKSKNVSGTVAQAIRQQLDRKQHRERR